MWKRISAFLFDGILLSIVAVLFAMILSIVVGFDGRQAELDGYYAKYAKEYGVDFHMSLDNYEALTEEERAQLQKGYDALSADQGAVKAHALVIQMTIMISSLGILSAFLIMEFLIPLLLKNGQTLGKKIFGLGVMRTEGIRINAVCLFIRTILGKYTFETMIPLLICFMIFWGALGIVGTLVLAVLFIAQLVIIIATHTNSLIHDLLAGTVVIDYASQMIFDTREDMLAYKQKVHAEKVANQSY